MKNCSWGNTLHMHALLCTDWNSMKCVLYAIFTSNQKIFNNFYLQSDNHRNLFNHDRTCHGGIKSKLIVRMSDSLASDMNRTMDI